MEPTKGNFIINRTLNAQLEYAEGNALHINEEEANSLGDPVLVVDHLILGSSFDVRNKEYMDKMNVGWILNVADECDNLYPHSDIKYLKISLADMVDTPQYDLFEQAFRFIEEAKQAYEKAQNDPNFSGRHRCILHCMRGRSRSATIAIAYLMKYNNFTLRDAYEHVKKLRRAIGPHRHLKRQLLDFEINFCKQDPSISLEEWLKLQANYSKAPNQFF